MVQLADETFRWHGPPRPDGITEAVLLMMVVAVLAAAVVWSGQHA